MKIAAVRLREAGNITTYAASGDICVNDYVIVEADRGLDYGEVLEINEATNNNSMRKIIRKVTHDDKKKISENKQKAKESIKICFEKIKEYKL